MRVARQIRATLDGLGHETVVLARPTRKTNIKPGWVDTEDVWAQAEVTAASDYLIPAAEYMAWAEATDPDLVLFDQNYQFDEIAQLRAVTITPPANRVASPWHDWAPLPPGKGSYVLVVKLMDERAVRAIACTQSAPFGGLAGRLPVKRLGLC